METFVPGPPSKGPQSSKQKNNKSLIFSKHAQFFSGASLLYFIMTWCKKFIQCSAHLFRHLNNYYTVVILNFTFNFLIILRASFFVIHYRYFLFGIPSGDFLQTNCSVDVPVIRVAFISKQIPVLRFHVLSAQIVVLKIILTYLMQYNINMPSLVILYYRTFHYHTHAFF